MTYPGGGSAARISNGTRPQNPGGGGGGGGSETWLTASREQPNPRGLVEAPEETEIAGVVADVARGWMDYTGSTVHENLPVVAEDTCDIDEFMAFAGDVAFAGASPVVFAGDAAVKAVLPAVAGAVSPAVFAKVIADDAVSLTDGGIVTADVTVWADAESELADDPARVVTVGVVSLTDAGKLTVGVADLAVAGAASLANPGMVSPADAGQIFPAVSAKRVTMNVTNLTEEDNVNVVGVQTCTS